MSLCLYVSISYVFLTTYSQDEGNVYLRTGEVDRAIDCYDRALELGDKEQEGVLLVMRGTALLQRAYACR
jgi:tetratricopeptide (TPR) repeat protein